MGYLISLAILGGVVYGLYYILFRAKPTTPRPSGNPVPLKPNDATITAAAAPTLQAPPVRPTPPGDSIRGYLNRNDFSMGDLAARMGVSRSTVSRTINQVRPIDQWIAEKLEATVGMNAAYWLNAQARVDAWDAKYGGAAKAAE